jgi:hypothetical protein
MSLPAQDAMDKLFQWHSRLLNPSSQSPQFFVDTLCCLQDALDKLAPEGNHYRHLDEGYDDMPAHVKVGLCVGVGRVKGRKEQCLCEGEGDRGRFALPRRVMMTCLHMSRWARQEGGPEGAKWGRGLPDCQMMSQAAANT